MATSLAKSYAEVSAYPPSNIDPREKSYDWIKAYVRAAYNDSRGFLPFRSVNTPGTLKMAEIRMYGLGKQPVDKYKKLASPGNVSDASWRAVDWTVPAFMSKFREIGISKILQRSYDITAFAVDPLAKSEEDEVFNKMKLKIMMRDAAQKMGSDLANSPELAPQQGEPQDMEGLDMMRDYGYKHIMAMEAEKAITLINEQTNDAQIRKEIIENLYDWGIGAKTQWIDENGMVKQRSVNPEYLGISYCEKPDFSDMIHWFEVVPTYVGDLAPYYTKEQLDDICRLTMNKNGNPNAYVPFAGLFNPAWNKFKIFVVKIKFLSWNETVYKEETDKLDNLRFRKTEYSDKRYMSVSKNGDFVDQTPSDDYYASLDQTGEIGQPTPKYTSEVKKVVYKASWILDTEYMHDYGIQENQNRKLSSWWDTDLDIQIYAPFFYKMQFSGITERLIPFEDRACMLWYNLQNLSNKLIPYLINIDFNAVEAVNFGGGGEKQTPAQIIDFIFSNYVVPYRSTDLLSRNPNYKPVSIEATGQLVAFGALYDQLQATIDMMRQVSGLNELTDGSTPNAKTLVPVAESAVQSTNNALYLLTCADKYIIAKSADSIVQKVQIALKIGKVEGYAKPLGSTFVEFMRINPDLSLHEIGIFLEDVPTDTQRELLWQEINTKEAQGLVTVADKIYIMSCRNLKEAAIVMDYKIRKRREQAQAEQQQMLHQQAQGNQQTAIVTSKMKQQEMQLQSQFDIEAIGVEKQWDYIIEMAKKSADFDEAKVQAHAKSLSAAVQANAKVLSSHIAAEASKHRAKKEKYDK